MKEENNVELDIFIWKSRKKRGIERMIRRMIRRKNFNLKEIHSLFIDRLDGAEFELLDDNDIEVDNEYLDIFLSEHISYLRLHVLRMNEKMEDEHQSNESFYEDWHGIPYHGE